MIPTHTGGAWGAEWLDVAPCRYLSSHPFKPRWYLYPLYPLAVAIFLVLRVFGKPFTAMKHRLNKMRLHVRVIPAWGLQYFMKVRDPLALASASCHLVCELASVETLVRLRRQKLPAP